MEGKQQYAPILSANNAVRVCPSSLVCLSIHVFVQHHYDALMMMMIAFITFNSRSKEGPKGFSVIHPSP